MPVPAGADEDVRLDAVFFLMMYRPKAEITLQIAETFLDLGQSDILPPDLGCCHRFPHEGTQQITAFAPHERSQFIAPEPIAETLWADGLSVFRHLDFNQVPGAPGLFSGRSQALGICPLRSEANCVLIPLPPSFCWAVAKSPKISVRLKSAPCGPIRGKNGYKELAPFSSFHLQ